MDDKPTPIKQAHYYEHLSMLFVSVTNIAEFNELLKKAKKQADELNDTIHQLEEFDLKIKFDSN